MQKEISDNEWVSQGLNAVPLIFESATSSVFSLHSDLGFSYTKFYCAYEGKFCEGNYWKDDIDRIAKILMEKFEDKKYIMWLSELYFKNYKNAARIHNIIDNTNLSNLSVKELIDIAVKANLCIREGLGVAHVIEPFSIQGELSIRYMLEKEIGESKAHNIFSLLFSPIKKPFIIEYNELLQKISDNPSDENIREVQEKFYWIKNNYSGRRKLTKDMILLESKDTKSFRRIDYDLLKQEKEKIIKKYRLSDKLKYMVSIAEEFADLQDKRKKNVLIAIDYFCRVAEELIKRVNLSQDEFYFIMHHELDENHIVRRCYNFKLELRKRMKKLILFNFKGQVEMTTDYSLPSNHYASVAALNGMSAYLGVAIGKAKICKNISQISKVEEGDILVTPMTRPEYIPAMKKVAAIITDEGGITCHASVVARELGKPCIIGLKSATKIFKDNDTIEVNANHGVVRRLR